MEFVNWDDDIDSQYVWENSKFMATSYHQPVMVIDSCNAFAARNHHPPPLVAGAHRHPEIPCVSRRPTDFPWHLPAANEKKNSGLTKVVEIRKLTQKPTKNQPKTNPTN